MYLRRQSHATFQLSPDKSDMKFLIFFWVSLVPDIIFHVAESQIVYITNKLLCTYNKNYRLILICSLKLKAMCKHIITVFPRSTNMSLEVKLGEILISNNMLLPPSISRVQARSWIPLVW